MTNSIANQAQTDHSRTAGDVSATRCGVAQHIPQIAELDCNPFLVNKQRGPILDARVRVTEIEFRPLLGVGRPASPFSFSIGDAS